MISSVAPFPAARALVFGDHVNADQLHPPAFFSLDPAHVQRGFLAGLADNAAGAVADPSWIIVAGRNFGCGSSRETTLQSLSQNGVRAVVARSFGRIFQRSAIARGLPCWTIDPDAPDVDIATHESVYLDPAARLLIRCDRGSSIALLPRDPYVEAVLAAGGLLAWLREPSR